MGILLALLASSTLSLQASGVPESARDIVIQETPKPGAYVVSTRTVCGGVDFLVEIRATRETSHIVRATADGRDLVLYAHGGEPLAHGIGNTRVIGLYPSVCDAAARSIGLSVRIYDSKRDGVPGLSGEATITATATLASETSK
jgi:hypothetical protein